jgi:hypothetical protein
MNRRILWLAAVLLGVFYGCDFGSSPGGGTGVDGLTGILVDSKGNGIAGAKVRVYPAEALAKGAATAAAKADSTTTDTKGAFRFRDLPDGKYNLEASITRQDTVYSLFIRGIDFVKRLDLGRDTLQAAGSLHLLVRNSSGAVAGAVCSIGGSPWSAVSDAAGKCTLTGIAPGTYSVTVTFLGVTRVAENLTLTAGASAQGAVSFVTTGGGLQIPSNWLLISAQEYVFYIPPDLEVRYEGYGVDSWDARYKTSSIDLRITAGLVSLLSRPDTLPGYRADTVSLDSNVRAIYIAYRSSSSGFKVGLQVEKQGSPATAYVVFDGAAPSAADSAVLATMLRSVRVWKGPGSIPLAPPPTPQLLVPAEGAAGIGTTPSLSWATPVGWSNNSFLLTAYRLQVSTTHTFATLIVNDSVPKSAGQATSGIGYVRYEKSTAPLLQNTTYFWRVIAEGPGGAAYSEVRSFATGTATPPIVPPLQSPAPNATGLSVTPTLSWTYWTGVATTEYYRVQVSADSLFGALIVNDSVKSPVRQTGLTSWVVMTQLTVGRRYFWRVIGIGPGGATASETRSFETTPTGFAAVPIYPLQGATGVEWSPALTWSPYYASNGTTHRVQVSRDSLFTVFVVNDSIGTPSWNSDPGGPGRIVGPLSPATKYYWRVITYASVGATYGRVQSFTTAAASGEVPSVPLLASPTDNAVVYSNVDSATFAWNKTSVLATNYYHLQVATDDSFMHLAVNDSQAVSTDQSAGPAQRKVALKRGRDYYWRVVGVGNGGSTPSITRKMTLSVYPPD